ncbi:MAG: KEOPS complex kinase/ATPase Bud32 [Nitrososphaera sp.]|nr:KEOPS complex kinase/ATPase Bud32 [Nitrososphaera sp.]NWG37069.1 Kae1-associated serine/threonine protein kinase [Nitrososphaera sp.]
MQLLKQGAEADIYVTEWHGKKAVSKVRSPKAYRHEALDSAVRRQRTVHEAHLMSAAKAAGVSTPFVHFVDPDNAEILMEFVQGKQAKDALDVKMCMQIGRYAALLHGANIIHGDLTTSNFIVNNRLVLLDFGLSYYSERMEDMAVDVRLIKEVFTSAHVGLRGAFPAFVRGYGSVAGKKKTSQILANVKEIEQRGRYARVE